MTNLTNLKTPSKIFTRNRDGITLLFVISMVVLFLLMGTTFMIVSNDFFKAARRRSLLSTNIVDPAALLDRCFYDLFRGPSLANTESPLRGHSILEDQYGYGIVATLNETAMVAGGSLVELRLSIADGDARYIRDDVFDLTDVNDNPFAAATDPSDPNPRTVPESENFFAGRYNGRVVSIVDGEFAGYSGRIVSSFYTPPTGDPTGLTLQVLAGGNLATMTGEAAVVINGRDFSGVGSGDLRPDVYGVDGRFLFVADLPPVSPSGPLMGSESLLPNRVGENLTMLRTNFLPRDNSPNEPYDIADFQNMFLGGMSSTGIIPSFHKQRVVAAGATGAEVSRSTFRPIGPNGNAGEYHTANDSFPSGNNSFPSGNTLDVDTDNDGTMDAVWIDIGLPTQTDSEGRMFRPLVAYRVIDLDNRLNLNVHGHRTDANLATAAIPTFARGNGYGVAEISLRGGNLDGSASGIILYDALMDLRYGADDSPGFPAGGLPGTQKLFAHPTNIDLLGQREVATTITPQNISLSGAMSGTLDFNNADNPYRSSFGIDGSAGESLFTAGELEGLLRSQDADTNLIATRLNPSVDVDTNGNRFDLGGDLYTTHSFEVNVPATGRSLPERLHDSLLTSVTDRTLRSDRIRSLIPREVMFGGKLNLNRPFGNGIDDDMDDIVDEGGEMPVNQVTAQNGTSAFDASNARFLMAKDLYISFLLACGDTRPAGFMFDGTSTRDIEYHRMVAQWAVNVVDFRDADSINTPFRFDPTPFDGMVFDTTDPAFTVWGCERPEILISETFAYHDRMNEDGADDGMTTDMPNPDEDWDSAASPRSGAIIELYNPWVVPGDSQAQGVELGTNGVDLGRVVGGDPVWRIALKRTRSEDDADILRTIFFTDPGTSSAIMGNAFFPGAPAGSLAPGAHTVLKSFTGDTLDLGLEMITGIGMPEIFVDSAAGTTRALSISDPNGGYSAAAGFPMDVPLDAVEDAYRDEADLQDIWVNGISDNFRFIFLQRLANPTLVHNATTNPYLTVDTAGIDLFCTNTASITARENTGMGMENGVVSPMLTVTAGNGFTQYASVERGASYGDPARARQNLFRAEDGTAIGAGTNASINATFEHSFGTINDSYDEVAGMDTPFGWLAWNNRPFASHMELLNVPYTSPGLLTYLFNIDSGPPVPTDVGFHRDFRVEVARVFGDTRYQHLLRFSENLGDGGGSAAFPNVAGIATGSNRFSHFLEFVETPSLFLGTETFLPADVVFPNLDGPSNAEFNPSVHGIPNFRVPGKININTITALQAAAWNNMVAGFPYLFGTLQMERNGAAAAADRTDFPQFFTTGENALMVNRGPRAGSNPTLHRSAFNNIVGTTSDPTLRKDVLASSYFGNELKQKLGNMATTRSSVFAIWITVGYFEVDQFGRVGAELATDVGEVERNRAFYIVDRSIPVALEPGKNHNVDRAVLVRTIIE